VWEKRILKGKGPRKPCSLKRAFFWSFSFHAKEKRNLQKLYITVIIVLDNNAGINPEVKSILTGLSHIN